MKTMKTMDDETLNERFIGIPIAVRQMGETVLDEKTHPSERFNKCNMIRTVRDYCNAVLSEHDKQESKDFFNFKKKALK